LVAHRSRADDVANDADADADAAAAQRSMTDTAAVGAMNSLPSLF
jgi:hypothetical protein